MNSNDDPGSTDPAAAAPVPPASAAGLITGRRAMLLAAAGSAAAIAALRAWPKLRTEEGYQPLLDVGDRLGRITQRALMRRGSLAPEYRLDQVSATFPSNGGIGASYVDPNPDFQRLAATRFRDWRLSVGGLVQRPTRFSLDDLRAMPTRTQVTMHCCDEGWSAIGQWTGVPLGWLLNRVGLLASARYIVFHALDRIGGVAVFDSIDLYDAFHAQTILAHRFNGAELPVGHGAPLRLRLELQIGYKNVKHLERIEAVDSLANVGGGHGGLFQQYGYQWYAGQ
mgnify:FL=1